MKLDIIYIRTSTDEQNPENQLEDCKSLISSKNEIKIIRDMSSAWKESDRGGFNELISLIKQNKIENIICWDLDRLYRNRKKLIEFFQLCKLYKIHIYSFRQGWLNNLKNIPEPFNEIIFDLMLQIMGWLAEEESTKKSFRVKASIRKKEGLTYSYRGKKWGKKQLSTQKKNLIIQFYNDKMSIRQISKELGLSIGVVHKYIVLYIKEKTLKEAPLH